MGPLMGSAQVVSPQPGQRLGPSEVARPSNAEHLLLHVSSGLAPGARRAMPLPAALRTMTGERGGRIEVMHEAFITL